MNYKNFSYEIYKLKQNKRFEEILKLFSKYKETFFNEIKQDKFLIANILQAFRKTNNSHFAENFLTEFGITLNDEIILNAYGWCLFYNIKNKKINLSNIKYTLNLLFQYNSKYSYNIISNILNIGIKNIDNPLFLDFFDKNKLSSTPTIFNSREIASDKEKWYSAKTKQLFNLKKYKECYLLSKEALEVIPKFHHFNEIWFSRRIALSLGAMGNIDQAIATLEKIYTQKKEWYILVEIAQLYFQKKEHKKSFELVILALNSKISLEFKLGAIYLLAQLIDEEMARKHLLLIKKIKQKKGYKIQQEILDKIGNFDMDFEQLKKEIFSFWKKYLPKSHLKIGIIKKILHNNEKGIDGFIKSDKDYYFTTKLKLKSGDKVKFEIINNKAKIIKILR